jgi:hypothetical protein
MKNVKPQLKVIAYIIYTLFWLSSSAHGQTFQSFNEPDLAYERSWESRYTAIYVARVTQVSNEWVSFQPVEKIFAESDFSIDQTPMSDLHYFSRLKDNEHEVKTNDLYVLCFGGGHLTFPTEEVDSDWQNAPIVKQLIELVNLHTHRTDLSILTHSVFSTNTYSALFALNALNSEHDFEGKHIDPTFRDGLLALRSREDKPVSVRLLAGRLAANMGGMKGAEEHYEWLKSVIISFDFSKEPTSNQINEFGEFEVELTNLKEIREENIRFFLQIVQNTTLPTELRVQTLCSLKHTDSLLHMSKPDDLSDEIVAALCKLVHDQSSEIRVAVCGLLVNVTQYVEPHRTTATDRFGMTQMKFENRVNPKYFEAAKDALNIALAVETDAETKELIREDLNHLLLLKS